MNYKKTITGAGEMVQWIRTLTTPPEEPGSSPSTLIISVCSSSWVPDALFESLQMPDMYMVQTHIHTKHTHVK